MRDLQEYKVNESANGVVEENSSPFTAQILAEICTGNFKLLNLAPYDGKADPSYHIQHYETSMTMQGVAPGAMYKALVVPSQDPALSGSRT